MITENDLTTDIEKRLQLAYKAYDEARGDGDYSMIMQFLCEIADCKCALAALYARAIRATD